MAGDRELEEWILSNVLGWVRRNESLHTDETEWIWYTPRGGRYGYQPPYTIDSWPFVAEALRQKGWSVLISYWPDDQAGYIFAGSFYSCQIMRANQEEIIQGRASAPTPGLAVCRAAKSALEAAKEG